MAEPENRPDAAPASAPEAGDEEPVKLPLRLPKLGTTLGSYKLVKLLGVGGMGRVYVAEHERLGRKVALKLLLPEFGDNPEIVQRFFNEARAVNQINHPNIVEIIDFIEDPHGFNYFIMELLDGRDLRKVREEDGPFLLGRSVSIAKQMASALAAAHGQGIVHRDIKPDNVVLLPREERPNFIKLLDFGIAKLSSGVFQENKTRLGMVLGTPGYMSPEQALGRPIDGRSDIYSLGVLLHWMLVDKLPSGGNLPMKSATKDSPPELLQATALNQPIPPTLAEIVERCLRFDPDDRVQTMDRLKEELAMIAPTDLGESAAAATPPPTLHRPATSVKPTTGAPKPLLDNRAATDKVPVSPISGAGLGATLESPANRGQTKLPDPKDAQTRIKLDNVAVAPAAAGRSVAGDASAGQADELAAFPKKSNSTIWIAAIAAAVVVAIGAFVVLRQSPAPDIQVIPPSELPHPAEADLRPPAPPAAPAPPVAQAPTPTAPAPAVAPPVAPPPAEPSPPPTPKAAPAVAAAPTPRPPPSGPKPPKSEHHPRPPKKHGAAGAPADDTQILDPLAE